MSSYHKLNIGKTIVEWWDASKTVRITLPDGRFVHGQPEDTDQYRKNAADHGYGDDIWSFCLDHEIGHVLVSWLATKGGVSNTIAGVADRNDGGDFWPHWWAEEAAVLGFQRLAKFTGHTVLEIAEGFSR
jgi:hypothetical protein